MTEYKKLVALTDLLARDVADLASLLGLDVRCVEDNNLQGMNAAVPSSSTVDPEQAYAISSRIRDTIANGCPRIRKMVQKARETDPNRQIYNEAMCGKIEDLFEAFCKAVEQLSPGSFSSEAETQNEQPEEGEEASLNPFESLLEPDCDTEAILERSFALQTVEDMHNQYILKRAKEEAWQTRVAQGLSDVVTFESQQRSLVAAEEKFGRAALVEAKRSDKMQIIRLLEEREAAKWSAELLRRNAEQKLLRERTAEIEVIAAVPTALQAALPDAVLRRHLVAHVRELIVALLRTPEDMNIRRLRNNNEHLLCDYGHPCLSTAANTDLGRCACASVVDAAEMLWHRMGYSICYTGVPNRSIETVRLEKRAEGLLLPCGKPLAAHSYTPLGFEDYSERFFELLEPSAMEKPDEWMVWYSMMQEMEQVLTEMLSH